MKKEAEAQKQPAGASQTAPDSSRENGPTRRQFVNVVGQEGASGHKPPIGYTTAFMHLVKGYVGTGIFAMGKAFKDCGLVLGPILLTLIAILNLHCQHMLVRAAVKVAAEETEAEVKPSFSETIEYTFESSTNKWLKKHSKKLGIMMLVFLCITELGFCCVYFVFIAEHMIEITSCYGFLEKNNLVSKHIMLAIILGPMWVSTFLGNLKMLMPLSVIANIVMWTGILLVFYFTISGEQVDRDKLDLISSYKTLPMFFGTSLFAFEGITFIIPLRNEMKHPEHYVSLLGVLNTGMTFVLILFSSVGILAYVKYGPDVQSSVFLNLPSNDILSKVTTILISIGVLFTFTLHMYIPLEVTYPLFHRKYGPFKHEILTRCLYRSATVLIAFTIANVVPFLGLFISLVGASTGAILTLVLPPIVDFAGTKSKMNVICVIKNVFIIVVGVFGGIAGTIMSVHDIVIEFKYQITNSTGTNSSCKN